MNETIELQNYLDKTGDPAQRLLTEAKLMLNPALADKLLWQKKTQELVRSYGRAELKKELVELENKLWTEPRFRTFKKTILNLFRK